MADPGISQLHANDPDLMHLSKRQALFLRNELKGWTSLLDEQRQYAYYLSVVLILLLTVQYQGGLQPPTDKVSKVRLNATGNSTTRNYSTTGSYSGEGRISEEPQNYSDWFWGFNTAGFAFTMSALATMLASVLLSSMQGQIEKVVDTFFELVDVLHSDLQSQDTSDLQFLKRQWHNYNTYFGSVWNNWYRNACSGTGGLDSRLPTINLRSLLPHLNRNNPQDVSLVSFFSKLSQIDPFKALSAISTSQLEKFREPMQALRAQWEDDTNNDLVRMSALCVFVSHYSRLAVKGSVERSIFLLKATVGFCMVSLGCTTGAFVSCQKLFWQTLVLLLLLFFVATGLMLWLAWKKHRQASAYFHAGAHYLENILPWGCRGNPVFNVQVGTGIVVSRVCVGGGILVPAHGLRPTNIELMCPYKVLPTNGCLYVSDYNRHVVLRIDQTTNTVEIVAGTPNLPGFTPDGGIPAGGCRLNGPCGLAYDEANNVLYIAEHNNRRIRTVDGNRQLGTVAGNGNIGAPGPNGLAVDTCVNNVYSLLLVSGHLYYADAGDVGLERDPLDRSPDPVGLLRRIDLANGTVETMVSALSFPTGLACGLDSPTATDIYIAGWGANRITKVEVRTNAAGHQLPPSRSIFAGAGMAGFDGDTPCTAVIAKLHGPMGVAVDHAKNRLYIADSKNQRIRRVDATGDISTYKAINLGEVLDVAVANDGRVYVTNIGQAANSTFVWIDE